MFKKTNPECICQHEWNTLRENKETITQKGKPQVTKEANKTITRIPIYGKVEIIKKEMYCNKCGIMKVKVIKIN